MLAKLVDSIPTTDGLLFEPKWDGFRAIIFRSADDRLHPEPRSEAARSIFSRIARCPARAIAAGLRRRRRDRDRAGRRAEFRRAAVAPAPGRVTRRETLQGDAVVVRRLRSAGASMASRSWTGRSMNGVRRSKRCSRTVTPPVYLTPMTRDHDVAAEWLQRFEGAGLDGVIAKPEEAPTSPASGRCSRSSTREPRIAWSPGFGGTRRSRTWSARCCSACSTTRARCITSASPRRSRWPSASNWSRSSSRCGRTRWRLTRGPAYAKTRRLGRHPMHRSGCLAGRAAGAPARICRGSRCASSASAK